MVRSIECCQLSDLRSLVDNQQSFYGPNPGLYLMIFDQMVGYINGHNFLYMAQLQKCFVWQDSKPHKLLCVLFLIGSQFYKETILLPLELSKQILINPSLKTCVMNPNLLKISHSGHTKHVIKIERRKKEKGESDNVAWSI